MSWCKCLSCSKAEVEDVTTLDFSCSSLTEVPSIVFNFERTLQYLYLDCNKIIELPRTLFQCEELRYLSLSDNEIETLPPLLEKLTNLENLLLNRNCLTYESIPSNIHRCQRLRMLHLSSNSLTKVPSSITRLVSLKELYLNNCDLEFLPANFGRLNNLRILELRENHLSSLPKSLKRLSDLRRLDISSNMFKKFPEVIGTMTNVTELWINDNFISDVPDCIGSLHKLTHFDMSCNRLEKITNNIGLCINMTLLLLSMNDLKELPHTIGNLSLLHTLKVDHNLLESLPQNIGKLSSLEELDVQFNHLTSFPNSMGMLRKLNSLVAAQNSISCLPIEIGSCSALSVLSLHYNVLMYLPEEIGHLQNLISLSLINNRLRYLPITTLSLRKLKALWLSHNQSQPLITLQTESLDNGQVVLTCVFLPQIEMPLQEPQTPQTAIPTGRRIGFMESSLSNDLPAKLNRIPTPHPKAFVKYQRTLENTLRKNQEGISQKINVNPVYVKEANIIPMKNSAEENEVDDPQSVKINDDNKYGSVLEFSVNKDVCSELPNAQYYAVKHNSNDQNNDGDISETRSECVIPTDNEHEAVNLENGIGNIQLSDSQNDNTYELSVKSTSERYSCYTDLQSQPNGTKPKQPPPYHIAAVYSRGAHFFLNSIDKTEKEAEPKHFTQDQPSNIINPQPKHARCLTQLQNENSCSYNSAKEKNIPDVDGYNTMDIQVNERLLTVTSNLLRVDTEDQDCRYLVEQFLQFESASGEAESPTEIPCSTLHIKLQIFKVTEYLLYCHEFVQLHKKYILQVLDHLQTNLDLTEIKSNVQQQLYIKETDIETKRKLMVIDTAAVLLGANFKNQEHFDVINQLLHIEKILPPTHLQRNPIRMQPQTEKEMVLHTKLLLIKIVIYFLSISSTDKEYKYIFSKFMQLQKKLTIHPKSAYNKKPHDAETLHQMELAQSVESVAMKNEDVTENKQIASGQKGYMNWVFGVHRNPKIVKVELTPCCYVLGFSVSHTEEGVFIDKVDKNGNAFQKLFMGDKILMLDDRNISKMDPEDALKAVHMWGPETETFLISRN